MTAVTNDVDLTALEETIEAVRQDRTLGEVTFRVAGTWQGGFRLKSAVGSLTQAGVDDQSRQGRFAMASDEPLPLLGSDTATSPGEYILQALAGCYTVTIAANAASRGIALHGVNLSLEVDFDLSAFLGIEPDQRPGARAIRVTVELDAPDHTDQELADLIALVEQRSPIRDTLANPVQVTTHLAIR